eukprot:5798812-Pyramimonas_sp.AAC.1
MPRLPRRAALLGPSMIWPGGQRRLAPQAWRSGFPIAWCTIAFDVLPLRWPPRPLAPLLQGPSASSAAPARARTSAHGP